MPIARYESKPVDVSPLGQPLEFEFSGRVAKNRFFKAAMAEDLATWHPTNLEERGIPTQESIELYRRWGEGGWGIIATGNIDIEFDMLDAIGDAIITPECAPRGLRFDAFRAVAAAGKAHGSLMVAQVTHPGRQLLAKIRGDTISASAIQMPTGAFGQSYAAPREATAADLQRVVAGFAHAAAYLHAAGFDGMQLHAAHGYLLSQFLSATTNRRADAYGGSVRNRLRLLTEIAAAVRAAVPRDFVLGVKLNSVEFQAHGIAPAEAREMCALLETQGRLDFVELAERRRRRETTTAAQREAYFLTFVADVAPRLRRTRAYLVGGFRSAAAMAQALGPAGISLGRPAAQEPALPREILAGAVAAAAKPRFELVDSVAMGLAAAGTQMRQLAKGATTPFDASDPLAVERFKEVLAKHAQRLAEDGDRMTVRGFPDMVV
ncbi:NADH:flavin oxidoreductase/NADH oxidase-like protein [Xylariomycetidae sp. FL0641]|nr:NADH:flavin oxidoreductase/NADH oxidase-like protein [Xylariomycetidae sp. FL0641]